jgi:hypothetical protein
MSALTKITAEAKRIRKRHPSQSWKSAIKEASRKYNSGRIGSTRTKSASRKRKVRTTKKRKAAVARAKRYHRKEGRALQAIGSVSHHEGQIKRILQERIRHAAGRRELAIKKAQRKKITREITKLKREYRAYC